MSGSPFLHPRSPPREPNHQDGAAPAHGEEHHCRFGGRRHRNGKQRISKTSPSAAQPPASHRSESASHSRSRRRERLREPSPDIGAQPDCSPSSNLHEGSEFELSGNEELLESGSINIHGDSNAEDPPDNSPYPQVRASVAATDNVYASIDTPRMWTLSLLCAFLGSATNLFFSLRYPSVAITPVIALVVVHPLGRVWDQLFTSPDDPQQEYDYGTRIQNQKNTGQERRESWQRRLRRWLGQGHWNEKEHACVYVSSNVSFGFAFATDVIAEQHKFYGQDVSITYQLLLTISTQILGYSFAGLTRRFLIRPPSMIWPGTLMSTAMFTTMHKSENKIADGWRITRWHFFVAVWCGAFAWYFLPGLLMPALSYFSVLTWFAPNNVVLANLVCLSFFSLRLVELADQNASLVLDLGLVFSP